MNLPKPRLPPRNKLSPKIKLPGRMKSPSVQDEIKARLTQDFAPLVLEVADDSARHQGHREAGAGGASHFRIKLVCQAFAGRKPLERHQAVYQSLASFLQAGVHALQMELLSPEEWHARGGS